MLMTFQTVLMMPSCAKTWTVFGSLGGLSFAANRLLRYCDEKDIADRFATVFQAACVPNSMQSHKELENNFMHGFHNTVAMMLTINL